MKNYIEFLNNIIPISRNSEIKINKISITSLEEHVRRALDNVPPLEIDLATPHRLNYRLLDLFKGICYIGSGKSIDKLCNIITRIVENTIFKIIIESYHEVKFMLITENISIESSEDYYQLINAVLTYLENNIEGIKNLRIRSTRLGITMLPFDCFRSVLSIFLGEKILEKFLLNMVEILREYSSFDNIIFVPYGRELLTSMVRWSCPLTELENLEETLAFLLSPIHLSYLMHVTDGMRVLENINSKLEDKSLRNILSMLEFLINGTVKVKQGKMFYEDFRGVETSIDRAPVSILNILSIVLPLLPCLQDQNSNALAIIEEPESSSHPHVQVLIALLLILLSDNVKLIVTTNSGLLTYLLYVLKTMKIYESDIIAILEELCKILQIPYKINDNIREIISTIIKNIRKINLKVYLLNYDGTSREVSVESLGENIPTITDVPSLIMDWVIDILSRNNIQK